MNDNMLTVLLLTYNHKDYIAQSIESVINQTTKYPYHIKILDDCSNDGTLEICRRYQKQYPKLITLISQTINTKGEFFKKIMGSEINTPYWTLLEGDDYWTTQNKIEDALAFLETNEKYVGYATDTLYKEAYKEGYSCVQSQKRNLKKIGTDISLQNFLYLHTSSRIFRNVIDFNIIQNYPYESDIYMYCLYLDKGPVFFDNKITSFYRITGSGAWSSLSAEKQAFCVQKIYLKINKFFQHKYNRSLFNELPMKPKLIRSTAKIFGVKFGWFLFEYYFKFRELLNNQNSK